MVVMTAAARRTVVLVRHAKAKTGEERSDHDRELTGRGRRAATEAGLWLASHVPAPELVWCSSALRALQTWQGMAPALTPVEVVVARDLYLASAAEVVDRVQRADARTMVVVGHNPTIEQVLVSLSGEMRGMRPGAAAMVDLESGRLVELWEPPR